jgi:hypothetical protein
MVPPYLGVPVEVGLAAVVGEAPGEVTTGAVELGLGAAEVVAPGAVAAGAEVVVAGVVEEPELQPVTIRTVTSRTRNATDNFFIRFPPISLTTLFVQPLIIIKQVTENDHPSFRRQDFSGNLKMTI